MQAVKGMSVDALRPKAAIPTQVSMTAPASMPASLDQMRAPSQASVRADRSASTAEPTRALASPGPATAYAGIVIQ